MCIKSSPKTIPRSIGHYEEWLKACKGGDKALCDFDFAGPITDVIFLGCIAVRHSGKKLLWDAENATITNDDEADKLIDKPYHNG